jgi:XTP/dITP diphosphohydrolase
MKSIWFLTSNREKIIEVQQHLKKFGIDVRGREMDVVEKEMGSHEEIAKEKAKDAANLIKAPVIVEDTGLYLEAYKGFPGIHAKFVANSIGLEGILKLLEGKDRNAYFKTVVGYCEPGKAPLAFVGVCKGRISDEVRGPVSAKVPYDSFFIADGETRTFSQMTKEEKAKYSHRAKAAEKFAEWFNAILH